MSCFLFFMCFKCSDCYFSVQYKKEAIFNIIRNIQHNSSNNTRRLTDARQVQLKSRPSTSDLDHDSRNRGTYFVVNNRTFDQLPFERNMHEIECVHELFKFSCSHNIGRYSANTARHPVEKNVQTTIG